MEVTGRRKSIAFFIALGVGLISVILVLYIGWILLNWRTGLLLVLGVLLVLMIICGIMLNTIFLVREIRRNEQHDSFINAVTHELKTPVASIRLYLQTLQTRPVDDDKRAEFYRIMLEDSDRLMATIEQVLRTGRLGASTHKPNLSPVDLNDVVRASVERVRTLHHVAPEALQYQSSGGRGRVGRSRRSARRHHQPDGERGQVLRPRSPRDRPDRAEWRFLSRSGSRTAGRASPSRS